MNITIRKINEADYPGLLSLFKEFAYFQKMPDKMTNSVELMHVEKDHIMGFVAVSGAEGLVGYATGFFAYFTWIGKSMYMDDLYVKPEYRDKGIGTKLIRSMIDLAKQEKCKKLRWQVSGWNQPAIEFYKSLGATIDDTEYNCDLPLNN